MHRLMRLTMHRAISQDSSGSASNPSTPSSCPGSAEVMSGSQGHRQNLWRESKNRSLTQSMDEYSDSFDAPSEKRLRNSTSDGDIINSGVQEGMEKPSKDVDCYLIQTLNPRTKFDSADAMVTGLTFKTNGDLVVSDSANHKVKSLDVRTGQLKVECTIGSKQATLAKPCGVTVLKSGQILVTDEDKSDLKLFTRDGRYLARFGRDLERPCDITSLDNGNIVVSDIGSNKIYLYQNLSEKGVVDLTKDVENGGSIKLGQPFGVAVTNDGTRFSISDAKNNTILLVDGHGRLLNTYYQDKSGSGTGASGTLGSKNHPGIIQPGLENPRGICQEVHTNSLLIADTENNRIVRLDLDAMTLTRSVLTSSEDQGQNQGHGQGHSDAKLNEPELLAVGPKGLLAVVDKDSSVVKIYKYMD